MILKHQLPEIYSKLLPKELLALNPVETKATCDSCAMGPDKHRGDETYRPDLKCCTFQPWLPNFIVGAILSDTSTKQAEAQKILRDKISRREGALPIGIIPTLQYQVAFNARKPGEFGNREDWLCPYYVKSTERCSLWRNRGSVCTSFHCISVHGKRGKEFWSRLENYVSYVEMALMEEALVYLDFSPRQVSDLLGYLNRSEASKSELKSASFPEALARKLWNGYYDDQEHFYKRSYEIVRTMNRNSFEEALGETGVGLEKKLLRWTSMW